MAEPRKRGLPYVATEKDRKTVELMTAAGIEQEAMCKCLGISQDTLARHYRTELDTAAERANAQVAATLFRRATNPTDPSGVTAAIWWTKTRMRWKEKTETALTGADGGAIKVEDANALQAMKSVAELMRHLAEQKAKGD
jgi:hypothetical protein